MMWDGPQRRAEEAVLDLRRRFAAQFRRCGPGSVAIEPGWIGILERTLERIDELDAAGRLGFSWLGIYEKYGELRADWVAAYIRGTHHETDALLAAVETAVERAEHESIRTCQVCAASGATDDYQEWVMTVCDRHRELRRVAANDA